MIKVLEKARIRTGSFVEMVEPNEVLDKDTALTRMEVEVKHISIQNGRFLAQYEEDCLITGEERDLIKG